MKNNTDFIKAFSELLDVFHPYGPIQIAIAKRAEAALKDLTKYAENCKYIDLPRLRIGLANNIPSCPRNNAISVAIEAIKYLGPYLQNTEILDAK